jgi:nicotinate-nucleotide adenylyltransferase
MGSSENSGENQMKIGVFGGTFNPVHFGHLRSAEEVRTMFGLERVLFIPSGNPPLKSKDLAEADHRYNMVRISVRDNPYFEVLDLEYARPGKSYTFNTLEQLQKNYPDAEIYFILGIDAFLDIPNWREPEKLFSLANFIVLSRPGKKFTDLFQSPYLNMKKTSLAALDRDEAATLTIGKSGKKIFLAGVTPIGISSTAIRQHVRAGASIKYLLPAEVESYIISEDLYKST